MDKKIYISTRTYSLAEPYIERCINSVLGQTYTDWVLMIDDNHSNEAVREKIWKYAENDSRIRICYINEFDTTNYSWTGKLRHILDVVSDIDSYVTILDADDLWEPTYLERMVAAAEESGADMVCCGSKFVDWNTKKMIGERYVKNAYIVDGENLQEKFAESYQYMRTCWGKLMKASLVWKMNPDANPSLSYGGDSLFVREAMLHSARVLFIPDTLYWYSLSQESKTYNVGRDRVLAPLIVYEYDKELIMKKCGYLSHEVMAHIVRVYLSEIEDIIKLIKNNPAQEENINMLYDAIVQEPIRLAMINNRHDILDDIGRWLADQDVLKDDDTLDKVAQIYATIRMYPLALKQYNEVGTFALLMKILRYWTQSEVRPNIEAAVMNIVHLSPLMQSFKMNFVRKHETLVFNILLEEREEALALVEMYLSSENAYECIEKEELLYLKKALQEG